MSALSDWLDKFRASVATERFQQHQEIQARTLAELYSMRGQLGPTIYKDAMSSIAASIGHDYNRLLKAATLDDPADIFKALNAKPKLAPTDPLFPTTGWLAEYLNYTAGNEVPLSWHFWCGMSCIAASLKRNMWLDSGSFEVWPNLYLMIVEEAASRKSTAVKFSKGVIQHLNKLLAAAGFGAGTTIPVAADSGTPQAFLERIKSVPVQRILPDGSVEVRLSTACAYFAADDLVTLFGKSNFNPDKWIEILTHLWDHKGQWEDSTLSRGGTILMDPAITFVGGTTLEWMRNNVTEAMVGGGFMSRCIYVVHEGEPDELYSRPKPMDPVAAIELAEQLVPNVTMDPRQFRVTDNYWEWFDQWYVQWRTNTRKLVVDSKLRAYYSRRTTMIHKIAMLLAVSRAGHNAVGTPEDLELADKIMAREELMLPMAFKLVSARSDSLLLDDVVKALAKENGYMIHSKLLAKIQHRVGTADVFKRIIETLIAMERVQRGREPKTGAVTYRLLTGD